MRRIIFSDIHGRYRELQALLKLVQPQTSDHLISVGDLIDRGAESQAVIEWAQQSDISCLRGNHEQLMLNALRNEDGDAAYKWIGNGGIKTIESFGSISYFLSEAGESIRSDLMSWVESLPVYLEFEDLLVVHAGVRPDVPLQSQDEHDLMSAPRTEVRGFVPPTLVS